VLFNSNVSLPLLLGQDIHTKILVGCRDYPANSQPSNYLTVGSLWKRSYALDHECNLIQNFALKGCNVCNIKTLFYVGGVFLNLDQLLDELGYAQSQNYRAASEPSQEPLTEHLFRAAKKAGVKGAYLFQTSPPEQEILPPRPAVYVAEAKTRDEAREIHQRLWNLGNAPFMVILLPNEIRVYTGFDFSQKNEKKGLVEEIKNIVDLTFENIRNKLTDFRSDSIDSGRIWETQAKYITPEKRVDTHLLNNLKKLEKYLEGRKLELPIIHALIGKYVYIRYLYDRKILSGEWLAENNINLDFVLSRNATLAGLLHLTEVLENRFNGAIFPLPSNIESILSDEIVALVASTFKGDDPISGQLHLDFDAYDFSYIPVETLSSIYEQFLHSQGAGKNVGAVYTPEPVADYLLCELEESKPLQSGMKILDPCCGSGIFLVLAYRRLIELALAESPNNRLKPTELRRLLESIYGIERNKEACYVAEFSLILTLLNYIDPPDLHRNKQFKFPSLHNTQIFECDFFEDDSDFWKQNNKFDWIVGNPPWIELEQGSTTEEPALAWINKHSEKKPVSNNRVCEAFTWRVVDLLKNDGCVGLLVHAKSLFNNSSEKYRSEFFKKHEFSRITNFSSLRKVLFDGRAKAPAATFIYSRVKGKIVKHPIIHCAPFVINQMSIFPWGNPKQKAGWLLTINDNEVQTVSHQEAEVGESLIWKIAFWGTHRDRKAIQRLRRLFPTTLGKIKKDRSWFLCEGIQLRNRYEVDELTLEAIDEKIRDIPRFNVKALRNYSNRFIVPETALERIPVEEKFVRKRGGKAGLDLLKAPHLVLNSTYALYSDQDFVIPSGQIGLSAPNEDADYLRALSIFRNSSIVQYYLFFTSPQLGVDRGRITLDAFENLPVPLFSDHQISQLAQLHRDFSKRECDSLLNNKDAQNELDNMLENSLDIPKNIGVLAKDFMEVRLSLNEGKSQGIAVNFPSLKVLCDYGKTLRDELDIFTEGSGLRHKIVLSRSRELIVCSVEFIQLDGPNSDNPIDVSTEETQGESSTLFASIREKTKQQFSQWVYVQRSLRIFEDSRVYICKSPRLIDWTRTQALNDSDDIIAEILSANHQLHEVVQ
jgi:type I restriction-modification system DNA methylase subunit